MPLTEPSHLILIRRKLNLVRKKQSKLFKQIFLCAYSHLSWYFFISSTSSAFLYHQLLYSIFFIFILSFLSYLNYSQWATQSEEKFIKRKLSMMEKCCKIMIYFFCWSHIIVGIYHHHWNFFHSIWSHFPSISLTGIFRH